MVSHGEGGRDSCPARGVTDLAIGSSGWLGFVPSANDALSEIGPWLCLSICSTLETHRGLFKIRLIVEHSELQRRHLQNAAIWTGLDLQLETTSILTRTCRHRHRALRRRIEPIACKP